MRTSVATLLIVVALAASTHGYTTIGNRIYDPNSNAVLLRGICRPSLEWSSTGENIGDADWGHMRDWGANVIRIPLNQCFWAAGSDYPNFVDQQVSKIIALGLGVILDLHWSDKGTGANCGQQTMPDSNSLTFWSSVAAKYKNNPWVIFELYNEPHDVSWSVWKSGGDAGGYTTPGFQKLLDTVRATGATNAVVINGLNWAYDLSGVPGNPVNGVNIIYGTHPYDYGGKQASDWPNGFGFLSSTYPVIATEFGDYNCANQYYSDFINYANQHDISWTAWGWYPGGCGFPAIISDWSGAPNGPGAVVKDALTNGPKVPSGTVTTAPTTAAPTTTTTTTSAPTTTRAPTSTTASTPTTPISTTPSSSTTQQPTTPPSSTPTPSSPSTISGSNTCNLPTASTSGCGVYVSACAVGVAYSSNGLNTQQYNIYVKNTGSLSLNSLTIVLSGGPTDSSNNRWNIYPLGNGAYTVELWGGMAVGAQKTDGYGVVVSGNGVLVAAALSYSCVGDATQAPISSTPTPTTPTPTSSSSSTTTTTTTTTVRPPTTQTPSTTTTTPTTPTPTTPTPTTPTPTTTAPTTQTPTTTTPTTTTPTTTTPTTTTPTTTTPTTTTPTTTTPTTTTPTNTPSGCSVSVTSVVVNSWMNGATYTQYGLTIKNTGTKRLKNMSLSLTNSVVTAAYNMSPVAGSSSVYAVDLWGGIDAGSQYVGQHGLQATGNVNSLITTVASFECY